MYTVNKLHRDSKCISQYHPISLTTNGGEETVLMCLHQSYKVYNLEQAANIDNCKKGIK